MTIELRYAARSDVGLVRKQNQDSGYAGQHLLVLADGMGGPAGGDIASSVAVAKLANLDQDSLPAEELLPALNEALSAAHDELRSRSQTDHELEGLGTTCIAVLRSGHKMAMAHIGDSRAYVLSEGKLTQVTKDHSFVQYLLDTGQITPEQAEHHPQKSVILRVLGDSSDEVVADESLREAVPGDRWLLCSDGLHGVVSDDTIKEVLSTFSNLDECANKLIELALRGGGPDNVTVVLFDVVNQISDVDQNVPQIVGSAATDRLKKTSAQSSAASKAAALTVVEPQDQTNTEDDSPEATVPRKRKRGWRILVTLLLIVGALAGGAVATHQWIQSQYYLIAEDDSIVYYQGIPQQIGPLVLAHKVMVKDYHLSDFLPASQNRLKTAVRRDSIEELDKYIHNLMAEDRFQKIERELDAQGITNFTPEGSQSPESPSPTPSSPESPQKQG